jgi:hypothetical protein
MGIKKNPLISRGLGRDPAGAPRTTPSPSCATRDKLLAPAYIIQLNTIMGIKKPLDFKGFRL